MSKFRVLTLLFATGKFFAFVSIGSAKKIQLAVRISNVSWSASATTVQVTWQTSAASDSLLQCGYAAGNYAFNGIDNGTQLRVTWHQDSTYRGLSSPDIATAWVAFTPIITANTCMRVVPGTHKLQQLPHEGTFATGQSLAAVRKSPSKWTSQGPWTSSSSRADVAASCATGARFRAK
jgi:hypothetical protein